MLLRVFMQTRCTIYPTTPCQNAYTPNAIAYAYLEKGQEVNECKPWLLNPDF